MSLLVLKIIRTTEVVLSAGAADCREFPIAVEEKFDLPFSPPARVVHTPSQIGSNVVSPSLDSVQKNVVSLIRKRIGPPKLGVEVGRIVRHFSKGMINLIVERHALIIKVLHRNSAGLAE